MWKLNNLPKARNKRAGTSALLLKLETQLKDYVGSVPLKVMLENLILH